MARSERPPTRTVLERVVCPSCGHFAAYKLDGGGAVTYGPPVGGYRCTIGQCNKRFRLMTWHVTDVDAATRRAYRMLRRSGVSRYDANLIVVGLVIASGHGTVDTTRGGHGWDAP